MILKFLLFNLMQNVYMNTVIKAATPAHVIVIPAFAATTSRKGWQDIGIFFPTVYSGLFQILS